MKITQIASYKRDDVPDHIWHEVCKLAKAMNEAITAVCLDKHPNLILSALNVVMAAMTKTYVSDEIDQQRKAAAFQAKALIGNIANLNRVSIEEFLKEEQ